MEYLVTAQPSSGMKRRETNCRRKKTVIEIFFLSNLYKYPTTQSFFPNDKFPKCEANNFRLNLSSISMIKNVSSSVLLLLLFLFPGTQNNEHLSITKSSYASILYLYLYLYLWFPALWTTNTCLLKVLKCINWCQSLSAVARFCTTTENTFQPNKLSTGDLSPGPHWTLFLEMF